MRNVLSQRVGLSLVLGCALAFSVQAQAPALLWTFDAGALIRSSPAVADDGTIYFGAYGTLYAITNMGSNKWEFPTQNVQDSSPAVAADGTIYYSSITPGSPGSGYLYAINPGGTERWRYLAQGGNGSPAIAADGTVYVSGYSSLHAVSPHGTNKWSYPMGAATSTLYLSPAVLKDQSVCIASYDYRKFYCLTTLGALIWSFSLETILGDSAALGADDIIYFPGHPLYAFSSAGTNLWTSQTNDFEQASPAVAKDGTIYIATSGSSLCAFSPSGEFKWQVLTNGYWPFSAGVTPAIDSAGTIYYPSFSVLYAISPAGNVQWSYPLLPDPETQYAVSRTSPTIGPDGTIYVTSANRLYAFAGTNKLADSPWPMYRQNARHTGKIEKPSLQQPKKRADANFEFQLYAQLGQTNVIETTTNLNTWTSLTSVVVTTVPQPVVDLTASNHPSRFYRSTAPP